MKTIPKCFVILSILIAQIIDAQKITVVDASSQEPLSYATVSFRNGFGTYTDADGNFSFTTKAYPDVTEIEISSVGYAEQVFAVSEIPATVKLVAAATEVGVIEIQTKLSGPFSLVKEPVRTHKEYKDCWQPSVDSEVAVLIPRRGDFRESVKEIVMPILLEKSQMSSEGKLRRFKTMFQVKFYEVDSLGVPSQNTGYPSKTFVVDQNMGSEITVDVEELSVLVPKYGLLASIQVLGPVDDEGGLIDIKRYREVRTKDKIIKVSTTYRPLLPFTDAGNAPTTYVRRNFFNDRRWQVFDLTFNELSALVRSGHDSYGLGYTLKIYDK